MYNSFLAHKSSSGLEVKGLLNFSLPRGLQAVFGYFHGWVDFYEISNWNLAGGGVPFNLYIALLTHTITISAYLKLVWYFPGWVGGGGWVWVGGFIGNKANSVQFQLPTRTELGKRKKKESVNNNQLYF